MPSNSDTPSHWQWQAMLPLPATQWQCHGPGSSGSREPGPGRPRSLEMRPVCTPGPAAERHGRSRSESEPQIPDASGRVGVDLPAGAADARACEYSRAVDCTVPTGGLSAWHPGGRAFKFKFNKKQELTILLQVPDTQRLCMSLARGPGSRVDPR
jgi:hypothetical protein